MAGGVRGSGPTSDKIRHDKEVRRSLIARPKQSLFRGFTHRWGNFLRKQRLKLSLWVEPFRGPEQRVHLVRPRHSSRPGERQLRLLCP